MIIRKTPFCLLLLLCLFACKPASRQTNEHTPPATVTENRQESDNEPQVLAIPPSQLPPVDKAFNDSLYALWQFETIAMSDSAYYTDSDGNNLSIGIQASLSITYPTACPDSSALSIIQKRIGNIFFNEEDFSGNFQEKLEGELNGNIEGSYYQEYQDMAEKSDEEDPWLPVLINQHSLRVYAIYPDILAMLGYYDIYEGGAHGIYGLTYYNIDTHTGEVITEENLFKEGYKSRLANVIQAVIKARNHSADEGLHIEILGELNQVEPNGNFVLGNKGITYTYNIYELSAYVFGPQEITVPYSMIDHLIEEKYAPLIQKLRNSHPIYEGKEEE